MKRLTLSASRKKTLKKYIALTQIAWERKWHGHISDMYMEGLDEAGDLIEPILDQYPEDRLVLSIIISELLFLSNNEKRAYNMHKEIRPALLDGTKELIQAILAYRDQPLDIESITVRIKNEYKFDRKKYNALVKEFEKNQKNKENDPAQYLAKKDPTSIDLNITGSDVIKILFDKLLESKSEIIQLKKRQLQFSNPETNTGKLAFNTTLAKKAAKCIDRFLNDHYVFSSQRKRHQIGAYLLDTMGLMAPVKKNPHLPKQVEKQLIDKFRYYCKPDN